ncbi:MAG TPA: YbaK/EbsC family protein, partial [Ktedonobacterales bacterium]
MSKESKIKTNAMRLLDRQRIPYEAFFYPDSIHSAEEVAALLGVPASHVFKTLVVFADGKRHLLVITPGNRELDMRLVAKGINAKAAQMAPQ